MKLDLHLFKGNTLEKRDRFAIKDASHKRTLSLGPVTRKKGRKIAG